MPRREQYVAQRIGARMASRGEAMVLRRITLQSGAVPYRNPPDVSNDLTVQTGVSVDGQAYLGVAGASVIGRLIAGDQILTWAPDSFVPVSWTVAALPTTIATDSDGIAQAAPDGTPTLGTPAVYSPDIRAANDAWPVIAVSPDATTDPAAVIGHTVTLAYAADQAVVGNVMQQQEMAALGWTEIDTLGIRIAADNAGPIAPPKIDDQLLVNNTLRAILTVAPQFSSGVNFLYVVQAR